jgi:hypothetical protein
MLFITSGGMEIRGAGMRVSVGFWLVPSLLLIGALTACKHSSQPDLRTCFTFEKSYTLTYLTLIVAISLVSARTTTVITAGGTAPLGGVGKTAVASLSLKLSPRNGVPMTSPSLALALIARCTGSTGMVLLGLAGSVSVAFSPASLRRFPGERDGLMSWHRQRWSYVP